jgi:outer membrane protein assembly factor BamD
MAEGRTLRLVVLVCVVVLLQIGCGGPKEDPILRLSAQEALTEGKALMEQEKYRRAHDYLTHAFEVEPNSAGGREALLLSADALYMAGGTEGLVRAEAKYRDFQNRFPTSDRAAYVQFQIANCLAQRMRKPDRDQTATRRALDAYQEMLRLYPESEHAEQAKEQIKVVRANLAEHEFLVGLFNFKIGVPAAAVTRFEGLLEDFPDYGETDKVLFFLGRARLKSEEDEEAAAAFARLRSEFPDSSYIDKIPRKRTES